jgi:hypothetical protein
MRSSGNCNGKGTVTSVRHLFNASLHNKESTMVIVTAEETVRHTFFSTALFRK